MNHRWAFSALVILVFEVGSGLLAQDTTSSQAGTRMELYIAQQNDKARHLQPAKPDPAEQAIVQYVGDNPLTRLFGWMPGLRLRFGGLPSGGGFSLGPEYFRPDLAKGRVSFRASAVGSKSQWYMIDTELRFPHLARRYLDLSIVGRRVDANSLDYYGPGSGSQKEGRSNYRLEESSVNFSLAFKPARRHLSLGFTGGYQWNNTGPGQSALYISAEKAYAPAMAPGIDRQTNYFVAGPFLEVDSRDKPKDPHKGTHFLAKFRQFSDRRLDQYSFKQIEGSIEQYFPFFNQKRVLSLRARSILSYPDAGNAIPFYMQPTLGGPSDLRGYQRYRFSDNSSFLLNAEYRWEVFTLLDAALFADAGKVFHKDGDFSFEKLESDVGFGFRFKNRRAVVSRIDMAFSHEGYGLWLTFDHVF
jgi:outer membrane protein assembly factor BamA